MSPCTCPRPRQEFVYYRKEFPRCLQRPRADVFAEILFALRIQSADDVSKGLEGTSLQQFFSPCTFTPPTRQCLRGHSRCKRSTSAVLNYFAYGIVAATAFKGSFQVQKASINGTFQYGVRKGASSFDFVDFCSSPSRQGYRKGPPRSCPCRQVHVMQFSTISRRG